MLRSVRHRPAGVFTALLAGALFVFPSVCFGYCKLTEPFSPPGSCELGTVISWPLRCVELRINRNELTAAPDAGQDLTALLRQHTPLAANLWSELSCSDGRVPPLRLVLGSETDVSLGLAHDGMNTVSINRRWSPDVLHRPGTIAITVLTSDRSSGTLLEADVELAARSSANPLGREFDDGEARWGVADLPSVLLHELGHVAGLGHSLDDRAVMAASVSVERQLRTPTQDDRDGLCASYPTLPASERTVAQCTPERATPRVRACTATTAPFTQTTPRVLLLGVLVFALRKRRETLRERWTALTQ